MPGQNRAPHTWMGFSTPCEHLLIITVQNVLERVSFCFLFSLTIWLQREIPKEPVPIRNSLKLAQSLEKLCTLMKGHAGLSMPWSQDGRERRLSCSKHHLSQGTGHKTDELFFTPNGKLPLGDASILDTETFIRSCKLITMRKPYWSPAHK